MNPSMCRTDPPLSDTTYTMWMRVSEGEARAIAVGMSARDVANWETKDGAERAKVFFTEE